MLGVVPEWDDACSRTGVEAALARGSGVAAAGARVAAAGARVAARALLVFAAGLAAGRAFGGAARFAARALLAFFVALLFDLAGADVRVPRVAFDFRLLFAAVDDFALVGIVPPRVRVAKTAEYISER